MEKFFNQSIDHLWEAIFNLHDSIGSLWLWMGIIFLISIGILFSSIYRENRINKLEKRVKYLEDALEDKDNLRKEKLNELKLEFDEIRGGADGRGLFTPTEAQE